MDKKQYMENIMSVIAEGPYSADWESLETYQIPKWYSDAKFGIFIHWGIYSVPAFGNEWYPRLMYQEGSKEYEHHIKTYGKHTEFGYKDFIPMFKAENFDAKEWADLFLESGAKYVMPVGEHHDGFQMYKSELSKWNSAEMGPMSDVCGELKKEVEELGMKFSISSHRAEHWWFLGGGRKFDSDISDEKYQDFYGPSIGDRPADNHVNNQPDEEFLDDWLMRTCEMVDRFHPAIVWFDWWIQNLAFKKYLKMFAAYYYNHAAMHGYEPAINYKYDAYPTLAAVFDVERGQLNFTRGLFWQTDTAVQKNSWGYTDNQDYKTPEGLVCDLVDIVSKNGALLLNIGPKADGTIPEEEKQILRDIGKWLKTNGEAIYNTTYAEISGEGPTKVAEGAFTDTLRKEYTSSDIRFTKGEDCLYAIVMSYPDDQMVSINSLKQNSELVDGISKITMLGIKQELSYDRGQESLNITLPEYQADGYPVVLKIQ